MGWIRTSKVFHTLKSAFSPLFIGIPARFPHTKKMKSGYAILSSSPYFYRAVR